MDWTWHTSFTTYAIKSKFVVSLVLNDEARGPSRGVLQRPQRQILLFYVLVEVLHLLERLLALLFVF